MTVIRHKENPFSKDLDLSYSSKQVTVSTLGKDNNVLVNQATGEVHGTHVVTYKKVDSGQFVKLFAKNVMLTFDLTAAGFKSFMVLAWALQNAGINRDIVSLDQLTFDDFMGVHVDKASTLKKFSIQTFRRGLKELESASIIAKSMRKGLYFINPNFVFNGNRIAFSTLIERER